jgi:predicted MFS family arabinose efflux permease
MAAMIHFTVFLFAYILSQFYRSFLAVIAPELANELGLNAQALGNMQAFWIAGFVAAQFPIGWALDVVGPRRTVSVLMLSAIAGAVLFARAESGLQLNVAMLLIGIGCAPIYMGALYIFGRVNRPDRFALLSSWLLGIGTAGNLLAASPLAWAAQSIGWRGAMLAIAVLTAVSALAVYLLIRDPPSIQTGTQPGVLQAIGKIITIRSLWPILPLTAVSYAVMLSERGLWAGPYFSEVYGLGPVDRGNALLLMAVAMSAGAMIYGPLDNWLNTRKWVVVVGSALTIAFFLLLSFGKLSVGPATLVMALLGATGMTYGVLMAHGRALFPDHLLGRGITLMNVLFIGGAGILQPVSGAVVTAMKAEGIAPADIYSRLHFGFASALAVTLAIHLFSRDRPVRE